mgnify:CR=1 FL=1
MNWLDVVLIVEALPEALKRCATAVGREALPQELAFHFVIGAEHQRFDEARIGFHRHDEIGGQLADAGEKDFGRELFQLPRQREAEMREVHHAIERARNQIAQTGVERFVETAADEQV